jgi:hypothetical protein
VQVLYILYYFIGYDRIRRQIKKITLLLFIGVLLTEIIFYEPTQNFWIWLRRFELFEFIFVNAIIQLIFITYHISSLIWMNAYMRKLIFFIGICFLVFSIVLFELYREVYQLFFELKEIGEGTEMFFWEGQRGLKMVVNNLSFYMALVFINMMIVLIVLFYRSRQMKSAKVMLFF